MQGEERLPEGLAQLILAGDPERLVLLHGVQSPFGGAVEPEQTVAVAGDHRFDHHGGEHERLVPQLLVDRKSTRLNSSHVAISYAVFCLKKKKEKQSLKIVDIYAHRVALKYTRL